MKTRCLTSWITLVAVAHVGFASTARAQQPQGAPPAAQPYPPPATALPPPPQPYWLPPPHLRLPPVAGPVVTLSSDDPKARLQTLQLKWRDVCMAPCGVPVDPSGTYRIGGGTIRPSTTFNMPRPSGTVLVTTETGSTVKHWVGLGLGVGGVALMGLGGLYLAASEELTVAGNGDELLRTMGIGYLVTGVVLTAIGIPMWFSSTSVTVR